MPAPQSPQCSLHYTAAHSPARAHVPYHELSRGALLLIALAFFAIALGVHQSARSQPFSAGQRWPGTAAMPVPIASPGPVAGAKLDSFIDGEIGRLLREKHVAGAVAAVVRDGKVLLIRGYGYADVARRRPVDPERTIFRAGSVSKIFTATAVMSAVQARELDLDTDVKRYAPDFPIEDFGRPVTMRNLLTHTGGFEDNMFSPGDERAPLERYLSDHRPARVWETPGNLQDTWRIAYSNWGVSLAGVIAARKAGVTFDELIDRKILGPLQMTRSTFREPVPAALRNDVSIGYETVGKRFVAKPFEYEHAIAPAGALSTTARDMSRFMIELLETARGGSGKVLAPETLRSMIAPQVRAAPIMNSGGLIFYETMINGRRVVGHAGDTAYFHTIMSLMPAENVGLFVSFNTESAGTAAYEFQRDFVRHYYPARLPAVSPPADALERNRSYDGTYRGLRRSYTRIDKAIRAVIGVVLNLSDVEVQAMPDGTLQFDDWIDGPARWVEIGDGIFRRLDDDTVVAFRDRTGARTEHMVGPVTFFHARGRVPWWENLWLHGGLMLFAAVIALSAAARAIIAKRKSSPFALSWTLSAVALTLVLACVGGFIAIIARDPYGMLNGIPPLMKFLLALPLVAAPLWAVSCIRFASSVHLADGRRGEAVHLVVSLLVGALLGWSLWVWNLIGYRFG